MRLFSWIIFIFLLNITFLLAQNFEVVVEDTTGAGLPGEEIVLGGHIVNLTSDSLDIEIIRTTNDLPLNWLSALCLELCAAPWINIVAGKIPPADSLEFSIHFFTDAIPGKGQSLLAFTEPSSKDSTFQLFIATTSDVAVNSTTNTNEYSFRLLGNYPNPFNSSTIIRFESAMQLHRVNLKIYTVLGKLVFEQELYDLPPGVNQIFFAGVNLYGSELPSGTYIYRLSTLADNVLRFTHYGKISLIK